MVKIRKTLQQKKLADLHQTSQHVQKKEFTSQLVYTLPNSTNINNTSISQNSFFFPEIKKDLKKTLILTSLIIVAEILLFIIL